MLYSNEDLNLKEMENWDSSKQVLQTELENVKRVYQDIGRKIDQSQIEVDKLAKRNASITANLQQVQGQLENIPRADIVGAYDAALDALQRVVVMRGQLEKFQQNRASIERYISLLDGIQHIFTLNSGGSTTSDGAFSTVEMMIQGQEAERQRLSRQMHDGPAQALSNFILQAEIATRLFDVDQGKARDELKLLKSAATNDF